MEFSLPSPGFHWVPKLQRAEWEGVQIFIERGTRKLEFVNFCGKGPSERKLLRRWLLSSSLGISSPEQRELWCDLERARFVVCSAACCKVAFKAVRKAALHLQSGTASAATGASCTLLREKNCFDLFCNHLPHVNLLCCCLKQMPFLAYYSFLSLLSTGFCHSHSRVTIEITIKQNLTTNPTLWKPFTRRVTGVLELSYSYLVLMYAHTFFCVCLK